MKRVSLFLLGACLVTTLVSAASSDSFSTSPVSDMEAYHGGSIGAGITNVSGRLTPNGNYATFDPHRTYASEVGAVLSNSTILKTALWGDFIFSGGDFVDVGLSSECGSGPSSRKLALSSPVLASSSYWGDYTLSTDSYFCPFKNVDSASGNKAGKLHLHFISTTLGELVFDSDGQGLAPAKVGGLAFNGLGLLSAKNDAEKFTQESGENVKYLKTTVTKFDAKTIINKNIASITRNHPVEDNTPPALSTAGDRTYYYKSNITISGRIQGKKTVIVEGGNVTINDDLYYADDKSLLVLVVKKGNGKLGDISVDGSVTNIVGTLIADGSLLSSGGISSRQLLVYGSLFTSNTIGGSIGGKTECPYGTACTSGTSAQYDLARFRNFTLIPGDLISGGDCTGRGASELVPTNGNTTNGLKNAFAGKKSCLVTDSPVSGLRGTSKLNPLVIEYNPFMISADMPILRSAQ